MAKQVIAIVGGGIAGVILAWQAHSKGYQVDLYNEEMHDTPSKVAAGILNPLSVNKKKPIWNADEFIAENDKFYKQFSDEIYHQTPILIEVPSIKEQNNWATSIASEKNYLRWKEGNKQFEIRGSAWIDSEKFITTFPPSNFRYINKKVDPYSISSNYKYVFLAVGKLEDAVLIQNGLRADMFRVVLGDILEVKLDSPESFRHLEGLFIVPKGNGIYVMGSTYVPVFDKVQKDPKRVQELIEKARRQGVIVNDVVSHRVAVRPATYDRLPMVGLIVENIYSFTGMGSRGLFHAPLLAKNLLNFLEKNENLLKEVDIVRTKIK